MQAYALQSVQMIDAIIAQAADAFVPCSLNCTTNIVHERAGHQHENESVPDLRQFGKRFLGRIDMDLPSVFLVRASFDIASLLKR